jgi:hypothetical protein
MPVTVRLSWREVLMAALIGSFQYIGSLAAGARDTHGQQNAHPWDQHIESRCAEAALAKALGLYWTGAGHRNSVDGDVAGGRECRHSLHPHAALCVHGDESDKAAFYLVTGRAPDFTVHGWLYGAEAKQPTWWRGDAARPCFMVPQAELRPADQRPAPA